MFIHSAINVGSYTTIIGAIRADDDVDKPSRPFHALGCALGLLLLALQASTLQISMMVNAVSARSGIVTKP